MTNMVGVGPFITIPLLMATMGGPQALIGWLAALVLCAADAMVWSELGAAFPGSGGTYHYLKEGFAGTRFARLFPFLFIWQFILSGPLEIASGFIGFVQYLSYLIPGLTLGQSRMVICALGLLTIFLLYRRITSVGKLTVILWIGTLITVFAVIFGGVGHFNAGRAFDFPPGAFKLTGGFFLGLVAASRIGIYDYLGYYDICYIGEEVRRPEKNIPRSILISLFVVATLYIATNLSIIGVIPWREFASKDSPTPFVASLFMERLYGANVAKAFTFLILWTALGSVFALLLGYSRIPYAAARDGYFFRIFASLHSKHQFPHFSLIVVGIISIICSFFPLEKVIDGLVTSRILVQFIAQIVALHLIRKRNGVLPYKMLLYPVPALIALAGWTIVLCTAAQDALLLTGGMLALGLIAFALWRRGKTAASAALEHSA
jgi:amino acid transporter